MNNPFKADRNIFVGINKPSKTTNQTQINSNANPSQYTKFQTKNNLETIPFKKTQFITNIDQNNSNKNYEPPTNQYKFNTVQLDKPNINTRQPQKISEQSGRFKQQFRPFPSKNQSNLRNPQNNILMSPIEQTSKHGIEDQQFMNIDAMSSDISKLLSLSKNQELCKILGIERNSEKPNKNNQEVFRNERNDILNEGGMNNMIKQKVVSSKQGVVYDRSSKSPQPFNYIKPYNVQADKQSFQNKGNNSYQRQELHNVKNNNWIQPQSFNFKRNNQVSYEQKVYESNQPYFGNNRDTFGKPIPNNNQYHQIQQNFDTKQTQFINWQTNNNPVLTPYNQPKLQSKIQNNPNFHQNLKKDSNINEGWESNAKHNQPEVYNYSNNNQVRQLDLSINLEKIIRDEMNKLSIQGKYRTFLTAHQKIKALQYNLQPI